MTNPSKKRRLPWRWLVVLVPAPAGGYYLWQNTTLLAPIAAQFGSVTGASTTASTATVTQGEALTATVAIQAADVLVGQISASGNVALVTQRQVALETSGVVESVAVQVGDVVAAGDLLLTLDRTELERAVKRADLALATQQNNLAQVAEAATASELAVAEAKLLDAQENLADVLDGPAAAEVAAARSSLAAAQASYTELVAAPSTDELTQLSAAMKQAALTVDEAQRAYDQVAWKNDVGASSQAATLQSATIDFEKAKAAYAESTAAASNSAVQGTVRDISSAQADLESLLNSPTEAEIATAQANVADAQATLDDLKAGANAQEVESAQLALEQALVDLEEAYANLEATTVVAPAAGTVMAVAAEVGEQVGAGLAVVTLADPGILELTISVSELDIPKVVVGQQAQVEFDALAGQTFAGEVAAIAPASDSSTSAVTYAVTIRLSGLGSTGVRPGMSAVATLNDENVAAGTSWLVPTNSIRGGGDGAVVRVVRNGAVIPVQVTTGAVQGEWTVVQGDELQAGDQVMGSVASYVNRNSNRGFGMGMPGGGPPPDGGGRP